MVARCAPGAEEASQPVLEGDSSSCGMSGTSTWPSRPVLNTLEQGGVMTGGASGSFEVGENGRVEVTLDGVRYAGVYYTRHDDVQDEYVTCLTTMSEEGEALWGIRATAQESAMRRRSVNDRL